MLAKTDTYSLKNQPGNSRIKSCHAHMKDGGMEK